MQLERTRLPLHCVRVTAVGPRLTSGRTLTIWGLLSPGSRFPAQNRHSYTSREAVGRGFYDGLLLLLSELFGVMFQGCRSQLMSRLELAAVVIPLPVVLLR